MFQVESHLLKDWNSLCLSDRRSEKVVSELLAVLKSSSVYGFSFWQTSIQFGSKMLKALIQIIIVIVGHIYMSTISFFLYTGHQWYTKYIYVYPFIYK